MKNIILLLALTLFPLMSPASEHTSENISQAVNSGGDEKKILDERYYKLLYENEVKSNAQILETMQWSISVVSGFILLLIGGQIFFSSKISKEEINLIKGDLSGNFTSFKHDSLTRFSEAEQNISENIIASNKEWLSCESNKIEEKFIDLKHDNKCILDSQSVEIGSLDDSLNYKIENIKKDITELEAHSWKLRGVEANALRSFLRSVEITIEQGHEEKYLLRNIKNTLEAMSNIEIGDYTTTISILEKVKSPNSGLKNEIKSICDSLPQFMYVDDPRDASNLISVPLT